MGLDDQNAEKKEQEKEEEMKETMDKPDIEEDVEEDEEIIGYKPPRELKFNADGELQLFEMKKEARKNKIKRQLPFVGGTGLFSYLLVSNIKNFSFATAGFLTYLKIGSYWMFGMTPCLYLLLLSQKAGCKY